MHIGIFLETPASTRPSTETACTKNMKTIIKNHNKNILGKKPSVDTSTYNCRNKEDCLLNGQCQIGEVVYESTLTSNQQNYKDCRRIFQRTPIQPQLIFEK